MRTELGRAAGFFNFIEVVLWPAMGLLLAVVGWRRSGVLRRDFLIAAAILIAFGTSDAFESHYGDEWWRPWWLLLWKAACVLALVALLWNAWHRRRLSRTAGAIP